MERGRCSARSEVRSCVRWFNRLYCARFAPAPTEQSGVQCFESLFPSYLGGPPSDKQARPIRTWVLRAHACHHPAPCAFQAMDGRWPPPGQNLRRQESGWGDEKGTTPLSPKRLHLCICPFFTDIGVPVGTSRKYVCQTGAYN